MAIISFTKIFWDLVTHKVNPTNLNRIEEGIDDCANAINNGMVDEAGVVKANIAKDSEKLGGKLDTVYYNSTDKKPPAADVTESTTKRFVSDAEKTTWNGKEPAIGAKGTAFNKDFGTAAGSVCQGNDSRLSDARIPTTHSQAFNTITSLPTGIEAIKNGKVVIGQFGGIYPGGAADYLGSTGDEWYSLYLINAPIVSSDRRKKTDIDNLDERYKQLVLNVRPTKYLRLNPVLGYFHAGLIAQEVEQVMSSLGLKNSDFSGLIVDHRIDKEGNPILDENGEPDKSYALRYEEFISPMIAVIQDLKSENIQLKSDIQLIKQHLGL